MKIQGKNLIVTNYMPFYVGQENIVDLKTGEVIQEGIVVQYMKSNNIDRVLLNGKTVDKKGAIGFLSNYKEIDLCTITTHKESMCVLGVHSGRVVSSNGKDVSERYPKVSNPCFYHHIPLD